jgi:hypothetical protein
MRLNRKIFLIIVLLFAAQLIAAPLSYAVHILWFKEYSYDTHFRPGELVTFNFQVYNSSPT